MNEHPEDIQPSAASSAAESPAAAIQLPLPLRAHMPLVTYILLGVTVFVYLLQALSTWWLGYSPLGMGWLELLGARINSAILAGEFWRLLTPLLLHGSLLHIAFNMYALVIFGTLLEPIFGHGRFLALYLLGGFAGNVLSFLLSSGYSIGASTAIFGLAAAEGVFFFRNRALLGQGARQALGNVVVIILINLLLGLSPGIDNWGHLGGLIGGLLFAWFAAPRYRVVLAAQGSFATVVDQTGAWHVRLGAAFVLVFFTLLLLVKFVP